MKPAIDISFETEEAQKNISNLIGRVENPKPLLNLLQRWLHAQTIKMFIGRRPDNTIVRGVKWPKLKPSTIKNKKNRVKRGKSIVASRPMVDTGKLMGSLKVLSKNKNGFVYGTNAKSKKGFNYPGHWNASRFPWLFLTKNDYNQMVKATIDFLNNKLKTFKNYQ
jgi:phage gpG-like protein